MNENENEKENAFDFEICLVYTLVLFVHRFCYFFSSHQVFYLRSNCLPILSSYLFRFYFSFCMIISTWCVFI